MMTNDLAGIWEMLAMSTDEQVDFVEEQAKTKPEKNDFDKIVELTRRRLGEAGHRQDGRGSA